VTLIRPPFSRTESLVKEIIYDHLSQTVTIQDQRKEQKKPPKLVSFWWNARALDRKYGPNLIMGEPSRGIDATVLQKIAKDCAMCHNFTDIRGWYGCKS
jgi:hypothetical protein